MSIHVKLSKEAEDKMNAQRRNSTILSLLFSGIFIALILVVFGLIALNVIQEPQRPDITCEYKPVSKDIPIIDPPEIPKSVISKPKAPAGAAAGPQAGSARDPDRSHQPRHMSRNARSMLRARPA